MLVFQISSSAQTWACTLSQHHLEGDLTLSLLGPTHSISDALGEFASVASSQVMLLLLVRGPHLETPALSCLLKTVRSNNTGTWLASSVKIRKWCIRYEPGTVRTIADSRLRLVGTLLVLGADLVQSFRPSPETVGCYHDSCSTHGGEEGQSQRFVELTQLIVVSPSRTFRSPNHCRFHCALFLCTY